jgi:hypothetical protein
LVIWRRWARMESPGPNYNGLCCTCCPQADRGSRRDRVEEARFFWVRTAARFHDAGAGRCGSVSSCTRHRRAHQGAGAGMTTGNLGRFRRWAVAEPRCHQIKSYIHSLTQRHI